MPIEIYVPSARSVKVDLAHEKLRHYVELTTGLTLHRWQNDLCEILERFLHERGLRLAIHGPPQFGKSVILSQRLPAWLLGHEPMRREVLSAYNQDKATEFTAAVRDTMRGLEHRDVFPDPKGFVADPSGEARYKTAMRDALNQAQYSVRAIGLQTGFTGSGAEDLFMDDPYASPEDAKSEAINGRTCRFWSGTARPRLHETANVGLMFHRYHPGDIAGVLLSTGKWEEIRFPAVADQDDGSDPTRYWRVEGEVLSPMKSRKELREIEEDDPETYWGQFQGRPRSPEGGLFKEHMFEIIERRPDLDLWMRAIDPASSVKQSNDSTATALVGVDSDNSIVIDEVTAWKRQWPETRDGVWVGEPYGPSSRCVDEGLVQIMRRDLDRIEREAKLMQWARRPSYLVGFAKKGLGLPAYQDLARNKLVSHVPLYPVEEGGADKLQKAAVWASKGYLRPIRLVRGPWTERFIQLCLAFRGDGTTPDDQIDAVSVAMILLRMYRGKELEQEQLPEPGSPEYFARLAASRDQ